MKRIFFITSIFALSMVISVSAQQTEPSSTAKMDPQAAIYYNKGIEYMKAGDFANAATSFDSSLQISKSAKTCLLKGQALLKAQKMDEAITAFKATIALDANNDNAYYYLGDVNVTRKNYSEAIASYKKVLEITKTPSMKEEAEKSIALAQSNVAIEFYNKGNELVKANNFDEAVKNYDQALAISKDYKTYYQKGLTLRKANKPEEAISALNACIAVNDKFDLAYLALAGAQVTIKNYESAIGNYETALSLTENAERKVSIKEGMLTTYVALGNSFLREKKYDKAIEIFKKATETSDLDQAYLGLAKAYTEKKQNDLALASLDKAAQFKKTVTDGGLAYYRGVIYMNRGDKAKAVENFTVGAKDPNFRKACESQIAFMKAKENMDKQKKK